VSPADDADQGDGSPRPKTPPSVDGDGPGSTERRASSQTERIFRRFVVEMGDRRRRTPQCEATEPVVSDVPVSRHTSPVSTSSLPSPHLAAAAAQDDEDDDDELMS